jgi:glycyl-tRNA synthetase beta chain
VVRSAAQWAEALRAAHVEPDIQRRRTIVRDDLAALASEAGGRAVDDPELVAEVANLCESPWGQLGHFDPSCLELPREVLITSMRSHQRYFALEDTDGALLPSFVAFNNTEVRDRAVVAHGHERVLKARLHDGRFFYNEDRKSKLEARRSMLERVTFLGDLAKVGARTDLAGRSARIEAIADEVCAMAYDDRAVAAHAARAAQLAKADLATLMVGEFPDLQGLVGADYAAHDGEPAEVATAIGEQYKPKGPSDDVPRSKAGICLAIADKLELMASCFAVGRIPSGNKDPFGLRRAALGVLRTIHENQLDLNLRDLVGVAVAAVVNTDNQDCTEISDRIVEFLGGRLRAGLIIDYPTDIVDAVMTAGYDRPGDARARVDALAAIAKNADLAPLGQAFKRINNILTKNASEVDLATVFHAERATESEEKVLGQFASEISVSMQIDLDRGDYRAALSHLLRLQQPLDAFFSTVMVMHEDTELRRNRLALLAGLRDTFSAVADISRIQVRPTS